MYQRLISQLAHIELQTPKPQESLDFFTELFGLEVSAESGKSAYLRCWGDFFHHSLQLTEGPQPALGHIGWRSEGPEQLATAIERLEASGLGLGWEAEAVGHGPAYRYRGPGGHLQEIFWEVERYVAPPEKRSTYPARPQAVSRVSAAPRQLDHVTVQTANPLGDSHWYRKVLGYRHTEYTVLEQAPEMCFFSMVSTNEKTHDLGLAIDTSGIPGRLNHFAFWVDAVEDVLRIADVLLEAGHPIEYGPGRHGHGEQTYLYFREPGGIRVEVNSGGTRIYQPDWEPVRWFPKQGSQTMYRNMSMPDSMTEAFPPADARVPAEPELAALANPWGAKGAGRGSAARRSAPHVRS